MCQDDAATNGTDGPAAADPGERINKSTQSKTFKSGYFAIAKSQKKISQAQRLVFE